MTYHPHPDKKAVVRLLADVASGVALDSNADHPEDIANAMVCAIEAAAITIHTANQAGMLRPAR